jgi:hypothetical protein
VDVAVNYALAKRAQFALPELRASLIDKWDRALFCLENMKEDEAGGYLAGSQTLRVSQSSYRQWRTSESQFFDALRF